MEPGDDVLYSWQDMKVAARVIRVTPKRVVIRIDTGEMVVYRSVRPEKLALVWKQEVL